MNREPDLTAWIVPVLISISVGLVAYNWIVMDMRVSRLELRLEGKPIS